MIEALEGFPENVLAFACHGHVTRTDYEAVLIPRVEIAMASHEKIRLYYQIDTGFTGIEPAAVWEDIKVGMGHIWRWERIAVVTDVDWIRRTMGAFRFLIPGQMKLFHLSEVDQAREWIIAG